MTEDEAKAEAEEVIYLFLFYYIPVKTVFFNLLIVLSYAVAVLKPASMSSIVMTIFSTNMVN